VLQSDKANTQAALQKAEAHLLESNQAAALLQATIATELKQNKEPHDLQISARDDELRDLRQKILELEEDNARLTYRASTISARHKAGDLVGPTVVVVTRFIHRTKDRRGESVCEFCYPNAQRYPRARFGCKIK
jgi:hypothetical protein